jgi:hypothetical protein
MAKTKAQGGKGESVELKAAGMAVQRRSVSELSGDPANARIHNEANIRAIVTSLERFGQQKPIVIDSKNVVRAGNGTLEAARLLGWTEIDCVITQLTEAEAVAFAIADNRTSELGDWDYDILKFQVKQIVEDSDSFIAGLDFNEDIFKDLMAYEPTSPDGNPDGESDAPSEPGQDYKPVIEPTITTREVTDESFGKPEVEEVIRAKVLKRGATCPSCGTQFQIDG